MISLSGKVDIYHLFRFGIRGYLYKIVDRPECMIKTLENTALKCYHCGDDCRDSSILLESKVFCCNGCKMVYELLADNSLCNYYSLESNPGNKITPETKQKFAYLDDEKIIHTLLRFQEGETSGVTFYIPSIHCSSCIWLLENLHKIHPGVITSTIQFQKKELDYSV